MTRNELVGTGVFRGVFWGVLAWLLIGTAWAVWRTL
jgi:hypothetical protein